MFGAELDGDKLGAGVLGWKVCKLYANRTCLSFLILGIALRDGMEKS